MKYLKKRKYGAKVKFRASGAANLLIGFKEWKPKMQVELDELILHRDTGKSSKNNSVVWNDTKKKKLANLELLKKEKVILGDTATSWIQSQWVLDNFGVKEPLATKELLKGTLCEQDSIALLDEVHPIDGMRFINTENFSDDFFTGTPDSLIPDYVEDIKTPWSIVTFFKKKIEDQIADKIYFGQLQVYMHLTGRKKARLVYCGVSTPAQFLDGIKVSKQYLFGLRDAGNQFQLEEEYNKYIEDVDRVHNFDVLPTPLRVRMIEIDYDPEYISKLQNAAVHGRKYYNKLNQQLRA